MYHEEGFTGQSDDDVPLVLNNPEHTDRLKVINPEYTDPAKMGFLAITALTNLPKSTSVNWKSEFHKSGQKSIFRLLIYFVTFESANF